MSLSLETVTLFNDMCLFAPGSLVDSAITFRSADRFRPRRTVRPSGAGGILECWSHDSQVRLASKGEARWHEPEGDYAYIELLTEEVRYNVR